MCIILEVQIDSSLERERKKCSYSYSYGGEI
jgi:hypothetical protein